MRQDFEKHLDLTAAKNSGKISSYVGALNWLDRILQKSIGPFSATNLWQETSPTAIEAIRQYVAGQKQLGSFGIFASTQSSYLDGGFCNAALRAYTQFLIQHQCQSKFLAACETEQSSGEEVARTLEKILLENEALLLDEDGVPPQDKKGTDALREKKVRIGQGTFKNMIRCNYGDHCAISGLNLPAVLRASHIVPWAEDEENRLNPCNGIHLSATYDAAFDGHLISFDEKYRLTLSKSLRDQCGNNAAFKQVFKKYEGAPLILPKQFRPGQAFLEKHREKMPA